MPKVVLSHEEVDFVISGLKRKRTLEGKKNGSWSNPNVEKISNRIKLLSNLK